ncbi:MAG: response regulator transcription factor [Acidobacteriota bacterium]|nr:response regulator transcription factor [Acidobacteriota bacterium]
MSAGRILVVDDDPQIRRVMRATLTASGYEVNDVPGAEEALHALSSGQIDLVLLDMNMPGADGLETCRLIRADWPDADLAIIMLTVRGAEKDKVKALDAGADDYVTKPFGMPELLARIRAALRRVPVPDSGPQRLALGGIEIDFQSRQVISRGHIARLTPKEFDLLRFMASRPNRVISHRELLQAVWGPDSGGQVEYLRVFVNQLRHKIEPFPSKPQYLVTEPWVGYRLQAPEDSRQPEARPGYRR